ncbi:unnamed protein product [Peniophora sp. CBMAI 1063]|nr:unnamed protein product [Peniophora sp. CBMAI 1063]
MGVKHTKHIARSDRSPSSLRGSVQVQDCIKPLEAIAAAALRLEPARATELSDTSCRTHTSSTTSTCYKSQIQYWLPAKHTTQTNPTRNTMAIGRLVHYAADAVLVSTILAGMKRSTGFAPDLEKVPDGARGFASTYLGVGETIYDFAQSYVVNSAYFKRGERR